MPKFSVSELREIREKNKAKLNPKRAGYRAKIVVHMGTCGVASGAADIMSALNEEIENSGLEDILVIPAGCAGLCVREPMATIETPDHPPVKYVDLTVEKIRELFKEHVMGGKPVEKYALVCGGEAMY